MEEQQCLNLCEILQFAAGEGDMDGGINKAKEIGGLTKCERIYFGSYFCGQYFVNLPSAQIEKLISYCKAEGTKLTLVVPLLTQKHLEKGKEKIKRLSSYFGEVIDEITVNDFGMLIYLYEQYGRKNQLEEGLAHKRVEDKPNHKATYDQEQHVDNQSGHELAQNQGKQLEELPSIKLNLGRLLMKDYRDPRYKEYFNTPLKPRSFTNYLRELIKKYKINGLEFDPTHAVIDFNEKPESVMIGLHTPYCYETVGQICQTAGIHQPIEKKFRPNEACGQECISHQVHYFTEEGQTWLKHGRTVYFKNPNCEVRGIDKVRMIYCPLEWEANK